MTRTPGSPNIPPLSRENSPTLRGIWVRVADLADHLRPEDTAMVLLGEVIAEAMDECTDPRGIASLSHQLLAVSDRLGLSPQARATLKLDKRETDTVDPYAELAALQASRKAS